MGPGKDHVHMGPSSRDQHTGPVHRDLSGMDHHRDLWVEVVLELHMDLHTDRLHMGHCNAASLRMDHTGLVHSLS
jgi:hypothetical protein